VGDAVSCDVLFAGASSGSAWGDAIEAEGTGTARARQNTKNQGPRIARTPGTPVVHRHTSRKILFDVQLVRALGQHQVALFRPSSRPDSTVRLHLQQFVYLHLAAE
jgi:hypothetical protein